MKAVLIAALGLALAGCSDPTQAPSARPSASSSVSASASSSESPTSVTPFGTNLQFGKTALVDYEPNARKGELALTVSGLVQAQWTDFAGYGLQSFAGQTPYYLTLSVRNQGKVDLGGAEIPVWAVTASGQLVHSASFANSYARCPSLPLPASFAPGESVMTCLVFVLPSGAPPTSFAFRSAQTNGTITWALPSPSATASPSVAAP